MIIKVLAIYDSKAEVFSQPIFVNAIGSGIRAFTDAVNDGKSDYAKHPGDYTLFLIGHYDDQSGRLEPVEANVNLGCAITYVGAS